MKRVTKLLFATAAVALVSTSSTSTAQTGGGQTGEVIDLLFGGCLSCEGQAGWPSSWCICTSEDA